VLSIGGMSCHHCTNFVKTTIDELNGIVASHVDLESSQATIDFDNDLISEHDIIKAVDETHFNVISVDTNAKR